MRILIEAMSARRGGGQTYLKNLLANIDLCSAHEVYVIAPLELELPSNPKLIRLNPPAISKRALTRALWQRFGLPIILRRYKIDLLFAPGGVLVGSAPKGVKSVVCFRNMAPFDPIQRKRYPFASWDRIRLYLLKQVLLKSFRRASLVIFISKFAQCKINAQLGKKLNKSIVIPHGLNEQFKSGSSQPMAWPNSVPKNEYLLYVSTFDVYKHHLEVLKAFELLIKKRQTSELLVFAGFDQTISADQVRAEIRRLKLQDRVLLLGEINYRDLPALYRNAKLHIFASDCENCPNILLEKMASARPVVCSNRDPMPEFGGDSVLYFDPDSPQQLSDQLISIIDSAETLAKYAFLSKQRAESFCWRETSRLTFSALEELSSTT
jgi:glycosyltransferase involved in cell wall biosynthesis